MRKTAAMPIPVIIVLGPTASGKSSLAVTLAQRHNGEVINGDAMAVYRLMNIGTAKPSVDEQGGIRHHCLDCIDPSDGCDLQQWLTMAEAAIADIHARGKTVVVCGGSPLYTKAILEGLSAGPPRDEAVRGELQQRYADIGGEALLAELAAVDPDYAAERHPNDERRIVRALEVYRLTGTPYSAHHVTDGRRRVDYRHLLIGLRWDKEILRRRINARAKAMFADGLVEEVCGLRDHLSKEAYQAVGYKEVISYLDGAYDLDKAIEKVKRGTRLLAKHQLTWYKRWHDIHWLPGDSTDLADQASALVSAHLAR
ncbi:MAG: tRNA (adenosine(37)-N6)-dimethylallyltransferase MiaA [Planctomycetota bacterium]|jgi:tRNA dimethylallyltransferase